MLLNFDLFYQLIQEKVVKRSMCFFFVSGSDIPQSHVTMGSVDKYSDGSYSLKPLKQKLFCDGILYLLQEIYGIENKNTCRKIDDEESDAENSAECVICMSDVRDTLILPCRHLCLCHSCADSLRYQVRAIIRIKLLLCDISINSIYFLFLGKQLPNM